MGIFRSTFEFLKMASVAHAKWDCEVSTSIIKSKKKLWILFFLLMPILLVSFIDAAPVLGGKSAYAPAFYSTNIFLLSIVIGFCAGLITGGIGAGGGVIITPALMAAGVKGILAVGTDLFHIFAKAIMGTTVHRKLGNVSVKLAIAFLVGSAGGTFIGGAVNLYFYNRDPLLSELFISSVYAVLLGFLGFYGIIDFIKGRNHKNQATAGGDQMTAIMKKVQGVNIPPMITFDEQFVDGGRRISAVIVALGGLMVGILAAIMGVGGGFITFPMFVYVFGVSSMTTVGTDILQIIFTAGIAAIPQYAIYGYVFYTLAMGMLLGSLIGIQIGALTTKVVKDVYIRGFYATFIIAAFFNRLASLPKRFVELEYINMSKPVVQAIESIGNVLFWVIVGIFTIWVCSKFFGNIKALREEA
jgi:uncharacterized membrane protein YfcA